MKKLLVIPVVCMMCFAACTNPNKSYSKGFVTVNQTEDQSSQADWNTTLKVKEALLADSSLSASNRLFVSVSTTNGVVTLSGNVENKDQMRRIISTVERVKGVMDINNQLAISDK